jgi:hypothetical protein
MNLKLTLVAVVLASVFAAPVAVTIIGQRTNKTQGLGVIASGVSIDGILEWASGDTATWRATRLVPRCPHRGICVG